MKKKKWMLLSLALCMFLLSACGTKSEGEKKETKLKGDALVIDNARKESDAKIQKILESGNIKIPSSATVYYVSEYGDDSNDGRSEDSPWCTLEKVSQTRLSPGSYVCFERGGIWRGQLVAQEGVTYTAYGEGEKPRFYASPEDGADPSMWKETQFENVWRYATRFNTDVGGIVFNHNSKMLGSKVCLQSVDTLRKLEKERNVNFNIDEYGAEAILNQVNMTEWNGLGDLMDMQFYHNSYGVIFEGVDVADGYLYLYSTENPGDRFDSIEFLIQQHVVVVGSEQPMSNVTLNNLCIKYTGSHGISAMNVIDFECSDLEVGDIGGSYQSKPVLGKNLARYGNGIQVWESCNGWTVRNCYVYNCFDAGVSPQTLNTGVPKNQHNITIKGNVIEYCNYCVEYFCGWKENCKQTYENFIIEDNYMWYAGQGICKTRLHFNEAAFIKSWRYTNMAKNFVIRNNVMIDARAFVMETMWTHDNEDGSSSAPLMENNLIAAKKGVNYSSCQQWKGADWMAVKESYVQPYDESFEEVLNTTLGSGNQCLFID